MKTFAEKNWGDCSKAVAYQLNFVKLCYCNDMYNDFWKSDCPHCDIKKIQFRNYEYPKSSIPKKKDYFQTDINYDMVVKQELMEHMLEFGVSKENFRPIYTKNHNEILAYQITPTTRLNALPNENGYKVIEHCDYCDSSKYEVDEKILNDCVYSRVGYPLYINETELHKLKDIAVIDGYGDIIISLDLYNHIISKYPRLECRPVFLGSVYNDKQYIRYHDLDEIVNNNMVKYSMLEFYSKNGNRLELGVFKVELIPEIVEEYMQHEGFNHKDSVFVADKSCYIDKGQKQVFALYIWNKGNYPKWDDELDEYDLDSAIPNDIAIFRNPVIAQKYLDEYKENVDDEVKCYFEESLVDIKYWLCDLF